MPGERYVVDVSVRWSDQDAYGHVNNAVVVTLLEEARAALLFDAAAKVGVADFGRGLLVSELSVRYRRQILWTAQGVRVEMGVRELRSASFRIGYRVLLPSDGSDPGGSDANGWSDLPAAEAVTRLVPYNREAAFPRRLAPEERTFLERYLDT